jgi:hypothetical protein
MGFRLFNPVASRHTQKENFETRGEKGMQKKCHAKTMMSRYKINTQDVSLRPEKKEEREGKKCPLKLRNLDYGLRNMIVASSTSASRRSLCSSKAGLAWLSVSQQFYVPS